MSGDIAMKRIISVCGIVTVAIGLAVILRAGDHTTSTRSSFEYRQHNSIWAAITFASSRRARAQTNIEIVRDEEIAALKAATPDSLKNPQVIVSFYFPQPTPGKGVYIHVLWLEDSLTLRQVIVKNPETEKEITITIPEERLHDKMAANEQREGFVYGWACFIPADIVSSPSQALEVRAPQQERAGICYPTVFLDDGKHAPTTQP